LVDRFKNGGVESMILEYVKLLNEKPILLCIENIDTKYFVDNNIFEKIIVCDVKSKIKFFNVFYFLFKLKPNLILSAMTKSNVLSSLFSIFNSQVITITSIHGPIISSNTRKEKILKFLIYSIIMKSHLILCVSKRIKGDLIALCKVKNIKKIQCLPNWFETNDINDDNAIQVVFSGRLEPDKDPIKALNIYLDSDIPDHVPMIFFGTGSLESELNKIISMASTKKHIDICGFNINWTQKIGKNTILLLTSKNEAFGIVVFEALYKGATIIIPSYLMHELPIEIRNSSFIYYYFDEEEAKKALLIAFRKNTPNIKKFIDNYRLESKTKLVHYFSGTINDAIK
jgi:glycosyltransferase involved in cell wall biosynthesis